MSGSLSRLIYLVISVLDITDPFRPLFLVFTPFFLFPSVFGVYNFALLPRGRYSDTDVV